MGAMERERYSALYNDKHCNLPLEVFYLLHCILLHFICNPHFLWITYMYVILSHCLVPTHFSVDNLTPLVCSSCIDRDTFIYSSSTKCKGGHNQHLCSLSKLVSLFTCLMRRKNTFFSDYPADPKVFKAISKKNN